MTHQNRCHGIPRSDQYIESERGEGEVGAGRRKEKGGNVFSRSTGPRTPESNVSTSNRETQDDWWKVEEMDDHRRKG